MSLVGEMNSCPRGRTFGILTGEDWPEGGETLLSIDYGG